MEHGIKDQKCKLVIDQSSIDMYNQRIILVCIFVWNLCVDYMEIDGSFLYAIIHSFISSFLCVAKRV